MLFKMKSDFTKKSVKKSKDEVKTLDKKAKKEIVEEPSNEKQLAPEKKSIKIPKYLI